MSLISHEPDQSKAPALSALSWQFPHVLRMNNVGSALMGA